MYVAYKFVDWVMFMNALKDEKNEQKLKRMQ